MSWMKRGPGSAGSGPGAGAAPQSYAAPQAQPFPNQQQNMYPNYPVGSGSSQQAPPMYWPQQQQSQPPQQPPYNQHYSQLYQQEPPSNANQFYQQAPPYNHNYTDQGYSNTPQNYQQNYYQNQAPIRQPNYPQNSGTEDGWEDNWDWGWEESAKQAQKTQNSGPSQPPLRQQAFNNANVIEESFAPTDSWNWSMDDNKREKETVAPPPPQELNKPPSVPSNSTPNNCNVDTTNQNSVSGAVPSTEEVRTLSDRDVVKERLPNLALGKRFHLDNLTPQWSIESQMSQESSDGPQTQSESTYRSDNHSRNSNSPGPNTDNSNYNYSLSGFDDGHIQNGGPPHTDEPAPEDGVSLGKRNESHNEISHSMRELSLANDEHPSSENVQTNPTEEVENCQRTISPPSAPAPVGLPPAPAVRPLSAASPRAPSPPTAASQPPPTLPPPSFPPPPNSQNPFKHAGPFGHKAKASGAALVSPAVVGQAQHARTPVGFEANLETTPDNSERPDPPHAAAFRPSPVPRHVPDNMEVAPRDDRNEYLQTAHLSSEDYGENAQFASDAPPPGLRRMVVGRHEGAADEPPPGLARMVPGRHTEGDRDDYMERLIDGRPTERAYRQPEGQRRPADYAQYDDRRVVTGLDRGRPMPPADARERDLDGSERELTLEGADAAGAPDDLRRDATMEGENLQDLGAAPPAPEPFRAAASASPPPDRRADRPRARSSADDEERDRAFVASPRRDRRKTSRDHDRDRDRDRDRDEDSRYSRPDRTSGREDRRSDKDRRDRPRDRDRRDRDRDRRDREASPDARRQRRSTRSRRYETEDTDYYSDKERDRRRHREGSYASKPPRGDERRPAAERPRDKHERRYRDIDPSRKYGSLRRDHDDDRRRVTFSSDAKTNDNSWSEGEYSPGSRAESREAVHTDEEAEARRRRRRREYYARAYSPSYADEYVSRQQYEYYSRLRASDPAAYMQLYKRLMASAAHAHDDGRDASLVSYGAYDARYEREERGSVHSGRSSAALKGNDTYMLSRGEGSLAGAPSLRTDLSDRDLNTDASLNLHLEESTVRSERMTPHRFSTAHVKGSISSHHMVLVQGTYPVDGRPATVQVLALPSHDAPNAPTPLIKGVTHKKSVIEYCQARGARAGSEGARDVTGYKLLWDLLALLLTQNGVVVGSDIAELLMKNTKEHEYKAAPSKYTHNESRRTSSVSGSGAEASSPAPPADASLALPDDLSTSSATRSPVDEAAAIDKLRELLIYGNRQEALEWALSSRLWGHALTLAAGSGRRARAAAAARFLAAVPTRDPLHSLYASLARLPPPALQCVSEHRRGDWRPHAAIILANTAPAADHDVTALIQLGDNLASRGLLYSSQFVYLSCGVPFSRHPLAPLAPAPSPAAPRLSLLLADPRAQTLRDFATDRAIIATEIYEYALSLNQPDYVITELQVYKYLLAMRLCDCGQYERALGYVEQAARAVASSPRGYSPRFLRGLAAAADRLKYVDGALEEGGEEADSEPSPRHQHWLRDLAAAADVLQAETTSPQHTADYNYTQQQYQQYDWEQQAQQQYQQQQAAPLPPPPAQPPAEPEPPQYFSPPAPGPDEGGYSQDWRPDEHHATTYADPNNYWQDNSYGYNDPIASESEEARPTITMPGTAPASNAAYAQYDDEHTSQPDTTTDRDADTGKTSKKPDSKSKEEGGKEGKRGWLGGFLNKLSLRPPNQMILPDDKNPSIVWDADAKRWKNLDGDDAGVETRPPPPPTLADVMQQQLLAQQPPQQQQLPQMPPQSGSPPLQTANNAAPPPVSNIFKMQKGRHIKKSYVDVFNPSGAATRTPPPAAELLGPAPALLPAPNYFVPQTQPTQTVHVPIPSPPPSKPKPLRPKVTKSEFDPSSYRTGI